MYFEETFYESVTCCPLTGAKLNRHHRWKNEHPLRGLILTKDDISDRSKADWFPIVLSILQISWLILPVAIRVAAGPTQLETATVAFSIFAVATFAANFWKPKDVSQPIWPSHIAFGIYELRRGASTKAFDYPQSFFHRLLVPFNRGKDAHYTWSEFRTTSLRYRENCF